MTFASKEFIDTLIVKWMEPDKEYQSVHDFIKGELFNANRAQSQSENLLNSVYINNQNKSNYSGI